MARRAASSWGLRKLLDARQHHELQVAARAATGRALTLRELDRLAGSAHEHEGIRAIHERNLGHHVMQLLQREVPVQLLPASTGMHVARAVVGRDELELDGTAQQVKGVEHDLLAVELLRCRGALLLGGHVVSPSVFFVFGVCGNHSLTQNPFIISLSSLLPMAIEN